MFKGGEGRKQVGSRRCKSILEYNVEVGVGVVWERPS